MPSVRTDDVLAVGVQCSEEGKVSNVANLCFLGVHYSPPDCLVPWGSRESKPTAGAGEEVTGAGPCIRLGGVPSRTEGGVGAMVLVVGASAEPVGGGSCNQD